MMRTRVTDSFWAKGADGRTYRIVERTEFSDSATIESTYREETAGLKSYKLEGGEQLNQTSPAEYVVVLTGLRLTKIG